MSSSRFSRNLFNSQQLVKYSQILTTPPTSATRRETGVGKFIIVHFLSDSKSLSRFMQDDVLLWFQPILLCCALAVRWWGADEDDLIKNLISLFVENLDWVKQIKDLALLASIMAEMVRNKVKQSPINAVVLVTTVSFACVIPSLGEHHLSCDGK